MFSRSPFDTPSSGTTENTFSFFQSRAVGALVLIVAFTLILLFAVGMDTTAIVPANATIQATQQGGVLPPGHPIVRPGGRSTPRPHPLRIPNKLV